MNHAELRDKFNEISKDITNENNATSKYRASAYNKVAAKIETNSILDSLATKESITSLGLSEYMTNKAMEIISGKHKKYTKKTRVKSPVKTRKTSRSKKVKSQSKSPSKSPSKSLSKSPSKSQSKSPSKSPSKYQNQKLISELTEFAGIGNERAKTLINAGIKHINQLHMKKYKELLPEETKIFLELKPIQNIPRDHIVALEAFLKEKINQIPFTITGSYRREKATSSDIDIMISSDEENLVELFFNELKNAMDGKVYPYSKGLDKMSLIVDMSDILKSPGRVYKLDVFKTGKSDSIPMLLYSTGSKEFNVRMRGVAKRMGYLLNQKGLFKNGEKIPNLNTEKDYFDILNMPYLEPKNRIM